jgi:hypothetical protein
VVANQLSTSTQAIASSPVVDVEPVTATIPGADVKRKSLVITEESATIEAVETALPAVVTVLSQGRFGGGTGSK